MGPGSSTQYLAIRCSTIDTDHYEKDIAWQAKILHRNEVLNFVCNKQRAAKALPSRKWALLLAGRLTHVCGSVG